MTRTNSHVDKAPDRAEEIAEAQVTVNFYEDATVFGIADTEETIVRYDLPARGITEGWTVSAVLEQTQAMAVQDWPEVVVAVLADDRAVREDFTRVLSKQGVNVLVHEPGTTDQSAAADGEDASDDARELFDADEPDHAGGADDIDGVDGVDGTDDVDDPDGLGTGGLGTDGLGDAAAEPVGVDAFADAREGINQRAMHNRSSGGSFVHLIARKPRRRRHAKRGWRPSRVQCMLVAGVVIAGLSGWWLVDRYSGEHGTGQNTDAVLAQTADVGETPDAAEKAELSTENPVPEQLPTMVHEHSGLRLVTPRGFTIGDSSQPGVLAASGEDPNLRIYVTSDQLHDDPAAEVDIDAVFGDILDTVAASLDLQEGRREEEPRQQVRYVENPGDQSRISWTSWVDGNQQLTVGCHSRFAFSQEQKHACELVRNSLERI